jgi:Domain of unknown function (DUF305)
MKALRFKPMPGSTSKGTLIKSLQLTIVLAMIGGALAFGRQCSVGNGVVSNPFALVFSGDGSICGAMVETANPVVTPFLSENSTAMAKMMTAMAIKPSGDIDKDFVAMMTPHHQGAIDMALTLLRYGRNEQLRRLAQEIIVTQRQEIEVMRLAASEPPAPVFQSTDAGTP